MKKYEFRGKTVKTGEWVYGYLIEGEANGALYIGRNNMQCTEVDPETIGQFIGKYDKHGNKIFEDDFVVVRKSFFTVVFKDSAFWFFFRNVDGNEVYMLAAAYSSGNVEIIGNIADKQILEKVYEKENSDT